MKPTTMTGYSPETTSLARNTVLSLATWLGDLMEDVVIVGGLVPSLLVGDPPDGVEPHAGTLDVDLALHLAVLDDERYTKISDRLRRAGAGPSLNADGAPQLGLLPGRGVEIGGHMPPRNHQRVAGRHRKQVPHRDDEVRRPHDVGRGRRAEGASAGGAGGGGGGVGHLSPGPHHRRHVRPRSTNRPIRGSRRPHPPSTRMYRKYIELRV